MGVKSLQLRPTFCSSMDCSPPASPLSMGFSRQVYWSGLPCPSPGDLPNSGIEPECPALQADSLPSEPPPTPRPHFQWHLLECHLLVMLWGIAILSRGSPRDSSTERLLNNQCPLSRGWCLFHTFREGEAGWLMCSAAGATWVSAPLWFPTFLYLSF